MVMTLTGTVMDTLLDTALHVYRQLRSKIGLAYGQRTALGVFCGCLVKAGKVVKLFRVCQGRYQLA